MHITCQKSLKLQISYYHPQIQWLLWATNGNLPYMHHALCMPYTPLCVPYTHFIHTLWMPYMPLYMPLCVPYTYFTHTLYIFMCPYMHLMHALHICPYACRYLCLTHALCALTCTLCMPYTPLCMPYIYPLMHALHMSYMSLCTPYMPLCACYTSLMCALCRFLIGKITWGSPPHSIRILAYNNLICIKSWFFPTTS